MATKQFRISFVVEIDTEHLVDGEPEAIRDIIGAVEETWEAGIGHLIAKEDIESLFDASFNFDAERVDG